MNYCETWRTNYFRVKDSVAFEKWVDTLPNVQTFVEHNTDLVALADDGSESGMPSFAYDKDGDDCGVDFVRELSTHLMDGEVALIMASGHEGLRYVSGYAVAVDSRGNSACIELNDIYRLAEEKLGKRPTPAER